MDRHQTSWMTVFVAWLAAITVTFGFEWSRIANLGAFDLLVSWNFETTVPLLLLVSLPLLVTLFPNRKSPPPHKSAADAAAAKKFDAAEKTAAAEKSVAGPAAVGKNEGSTQAGGLHAAWWNVFLQSVAIAALSLFSSWGIGQTEISVRDAEGQILSIPFAKLPPAYHDEYSYLLQAETFRAGRLSWPKAEVAPAAFHQFHVLNEHTTISRYFPLTGLWMAPFLKGPFSADSFSAGSYLSGPFSAGNAIWGHWIAGALSAVFFFWSARLLMPARAAACCGILLAVSPGLAIFSNMLLAHHPVMLMLSVFLYSFLRLMSPRANDAARRHHSIAWAVLSGCALSAAMLGRPMTAAGFTAPFGIWLFVELIRRRISWLVIPAFAVPLLAGFSFLALMNHAATGNLFRTAYQEYTDQFTPRHKYGFHNATHCEVAHGPPAVKKYDQWATNLDGITAAKNVWLRTKFSLFWIWNTIILTMGLAAAVFELIRSWCCSNGDVGPRRTPFARSGLLVMLAAVFSLHVVHIPYWYAGIMEWHYVFETAPLILLLAGFGLFCFHRSVTTIANPKLASVWLLLLITGTLVPAWFGSENSFGDSKVDLWINQTAYSRRRMAEFRLAAKQVAATGPVLIFVDEAHTDPQLSFIINPPNYEGPVIVCRLPESQQERQTITDDFPGRQQYYFDASQPVVMLQPFRNQLPLKAEPRE